MQFGVLYLYLSIDESMVSYLVVKCLFATNQSNLVSKYECYVGQTVIRTTCLYIVVEVRGINWSITLSVHESLTKCYKWFKHIQLF